MPQQEVHLGIAGFVNILVLTLIVSCCCQVFQFVVHVLFSDFDQNYSLLAFMQLRRLKHLRLPKEIGFPFIFIDGIRMRFAILFRSHGEWTIFAHSVQFSSI